ncbi:MAG: tripartite tricarboxylate transporter TctB family protein [Armatimonadota bacterium]|nr:tripartite tricarboxylate transporter TctB family protein [Armatimonadota bacterium]
MRLPDRAAGLVFGLFGLFVAASAVRLGLGKWLSPGPGFFPFGVGLATLVLGVALALPAARGGAGRGTAARSGAGAVKTAGAIAVLAAYALLLERLGFAPTTFLFIVAWVGGLERTRWKGTVSLAAAVTAAMYAIFVRWLQVPLPSGVLGR